MSTNTVTAFHMHRHTHRHMHRHTHRYTHIHMHVNHEKNAQSIKMTTVAIFNTTVFCG